MTADTSLTHTQRQAAHDVAVLAKPLDHVTALNGIGTLDAAGEHAAADALRHLDQQHAAALRVAERALHALDALERLHATRARGAESATARDLWRSAFETLSLENEHLRGLLCPCPSNAPADFEPDPRCPVHGDPAGPRMAVRDALAWHDAFERLARAVQEACAFDGGETLPEDAPWAAALDRLDTALGEIRDAVKDVVS